MVNSFMTLSDTVKALEDNKIAVALDLGLHVHCDINSNCPVAVELRRIIKDTGIPITKLLESYVESRVTPPQALPLELPLIDGKVSINIAGNPVELDLTASINNTLERARSSKIADLLLAEQVIIRAGWKYYNSYLEAIDEAHKEKKLPQLSFGFSDLIKYNCMLSSESDNYLFILPIEYKPQWLVHENIRFELTEKDIQLCKRDVFLVFSISREGKMLRAYLIDDSGARFNHYHGRGGDCWGSNKFPEKWDGTLRSLRAIANHLEKSLTTINGDSLMSYRPSGFPSFDDLKDRSKRLGKEGEIKEPIIFDIDEDDASPSPTPQRRGWGGTGQ